MDRGHFPFHHLARRSVDGNDVTFPDDITLSRKGLFIIIDTQGAGTRDTRGSHTTGDNGGVGCHTAPGGDDALGHMHTTNILRRRFDANENYFLASLCPAFGIGAAEYDAARRRPRRGRQANAKHLTFGVRVQGRVQDLIQLPWIDTGNRLAFIDQTFVDHIDGNFHGRPGGALSVTCLQHPQTSLLNSELHVLHVFVMAFEATSYAKQFPISFRHRFFHR